LLAIMFLFCSIPAHEQHPLPRPLPHHPATSGARALPKPPRWGGKARSAMRDFTLLLTLAWGVAELALMLSGG